jgi:hypothetical protein
MAFKRKKRQSKEVPEEGSLTTDLEGFVQSMAIDFNLEPAKTRGQPRVIPAVALWTGILVGVIRGMSSQLEIWRLLTRQGLWDFPRYGVGDDAVYKRLKKAGQDTFKAIFMQVTAVLEQRYGKPVQKLASFATGVYAMDEMTLERIKKRLPSLRGSQEAVLPGVMSVLFDVLKQRFFKIEFHQEVDQNEKVAARGMVVGLAKKSLILADLGYFAFAWFDELTDLSYYWVSRLREKTSYKVIQTLYSSQNQTDAIVWLGRYRADKAKHAVRLIELKHQGRTWRYISNVLDPELLSARDIAQLYARRWDIEMMFNLVKRYLNLHCMWSSTLNVVLHQVYAVFTVAQIILCMRSEIAQKAKADVYEVSLDLIIRWIPRFAKNGVDPIKTIAEQGRAMKIIRPTTRMKWLPKEVDVKHYSKLPPDTQLVRQERYASKS